MMDAETRLFSFKPGNTWLMLLVCAHVVIFCISLRFTDYYRGLHIFYDPALLPLAIVSVASLCLLLPAFAIARFSFGYWVSFHSAWSWGSGSRSDIITCTGVWF